MSNKLTKAKWDKEINGSEKAIASKFSLSFNEIDTIAFHCNVLQDYLYAPFKALRKLHDNYVTCKVKLEEIGEIANQLNKRQADLNEKVRESQIKATEENKPWEEPEDLKAVRLDHNKSIEDFNKKKYDINLFTVAESDFPEDRAKFEKKTVQVGQMQPREVDTFTSFLELLGSVITD